MDGKEQQPYFRDCSSVASHEEEWLNIQQTPCPRSNFANIAVPADYNVVNPLTSANSVGVPQYRNQYPTNIPYVNTNQHVFQHLGNQQQQQQHVSGNIQQNACVSTNAGMKRSDINFGVREISDMIPDFNPSSREGVSVNYWLECIEQMCSIYQLNDRLVLFAAASKLKGEANTWYFTEMRSGSIRNWYQFREGLTREFGSNRDPVDIHSILSSRRRHQSESYSQYVYEMRKIASEINLDELSVIKYIIRGLNDPDFTKSLASQDIYSVHVLLERIRKYQSIVPIRTNDSNVDKHLQNNNYNNNINRSNYNKNRYSAVQNKPRHDNAYRRIICSFCRREGHYEVNCPSKKQDVRRIELENEYVKMIKVNGIDVKTFIDLGSDCVTIRESIARRLRLEKTPNHMSRKLRGFGNSQVSTLGETVVDIDIDDVQIKNVKVLIVPDFSQREALMIRRSVLDKENIVVLKAHKLLQIVKLPMHEDEMSINKENEKYNFKLSANIKSGSCVNDHVSSDVNTSNIRDEIEKVQNSMGNEDNFVQLISEGYFDGQVDSKYNSNMSVDLRNQLGSENDHNASEKSLNKQFTQISNDVFNSCIDEKIDVATKNNIKRLINEYRDCFAMNLRELGKTDKTEIVIELSDKEPVCYRPYRLSPVQLTEVRGQINELLELGIVKPSNSEYASPIVVVKKKNGENRICVDFRRLNVKIIKDRFPIPNMEDSLQLSKWR